MTLNDLRKIAGLKNFSKVTEKILSVWLISDMSDLRDKSQYGNEKGISVNHYLIKMIHEILTSVDKNSSNEKFAVICTMIDWKQAFDRQCPKLGVESFMKNGVRRYLIPLLTNYLQDRKMFVKWNGEISETMDLNGGGPQGALWGILEYLSLSNDNTSHIPLKEKYKYIDDLSILEKVNLLALSYLHTTLNAMWHQILSKMATSFTQKICRLKPTLTEYLNGQSKSKCC